MKSALILSVLLNWNDIELNQKVNLNSDIVFNEKIKLNKGDAFSLEDTMAFQAPVMYFSFKNLNCVDPGLKADMVLFNPEPDDIDHDKSIGVEIEPNCYVGIYIEPKYYYNISVFSKPLND